MEIDPKDVLAHVFHQLQYDWLSLTVRATTALAEFSTNHALLEVIRTECGQFLLLHLDY